MLLTDKKSMKRLAGEIITKGLSVREVEKLVKQEHSGEPPSRKPATAGGVLESEVARCLTERFGRKVSVVAGKNKGIVEIEYYGEDDLKELSKDSCRRANQK